MQSRRDILRTATVGAGVGMTTLLAGCSDETSGDNGSENGDENDDNGGEDDGSGDGTGTETADSSLATEYVDWVYDFESVQNASRTVSVTEMEGYVNGLPNDDGVRENFETGYGGAISVDDVEYAVDIGFASVLTGTFDAGEVADAMELSAEDSYGGFDLYVSETDRGPVLASDGDYLLKSDGYSIDPRDEVEALIDAYNGDADRFVDVSDPFERIVAESETETAQLVSLAVPTEDTTEDGSVAYSQTITIDGAESTVRLLQLYDNEDAVDLEQIESQIERDDTAELTELSQDGRLLIAEVTVPTEELA